MLDQLFNEVWTSVNNIWTIQNIQNYSYIWNILKTINFIQNISS